VLEPVVVLEVVPVALLLDPAPPGPSPLALDAVVPAPLAIVPL
jgi:hypothetical protein